MKTIFLIIFVSALCNVPAFGKGTTNSSKVINFEDETIEGINRKPLDSFNQISENDQKKNAHLYRRRASFQDRDEILFIEMRLNQ